jgi:hypothetical protein
MLSNEERRKLNDTSIDPQSRAIIRYAMEINDPWLAEFVRRADAGEEIGAPLNIEETPDTNNDDPDEEKIEALTELTVASVTSQGSKRPPCSCSWRQ